MSYSSYILLKYKGLNHCWKRVQEQGEEFLPKMKILHTALHCMKINGEKLSCCEVPIKKKKKKVGQA